MKAFNLHDRCSSQETSRRRQEQERIRSSLALDNPFRCRHPVPLFWTLNKLHTNVGNLFAMIDWALTAHSKNNDPIIFHARSKQGWQIPRLNVNRSMLCCRPIVTGQVENCKSVQDGVRMGCVNPIAYALIDLAQPRRQHLFRRPVRKMQAISLQCFGSFFWMQRSLLAGLVHVFNKERKMHRFHGLARRLSNFRCEEGRRASKLAQR